MIYRPPAHLRMWDTWMLREGDQYHLFTLTQLYGKPAWDRVCHAVTRDWLHWEEWEEIPLEAEGEAWDAGTILTGTAFRTQDGWGMTYGALREGEGIQRIGLLLSRDLHTWEKHPANPVLVPQGPFYEATLEETADPTVPWRDAYVMPGAEGYEAFVCAADRSKARTTNGCIARATSRNLTEWEIHPPIVSPERYLDMEVPQYFTWNSYHYLLFSTGGNQRRVDVPSRERCTGTFYLMADEKYGPYRLPEDNLLIGSGEGTATAYVGKVLETAEGRLLYHHLTGYRTAFASPKVLRQREDGTLFVERWPGLDGLLGEKRLDGASPGEVIRAGGRQAVGEWRVAGAALTGEGGAAMSGWLFEEVLGDFGASCRLDLAQAERAGVIFRVAEEQASGEEGGAWAISVDRKRSRYELCRTVLQGRVAVQLQPVDIVHAPNCGSCLVEVFVRDSYVEIYADRRPLFLLNTSMVTASDHVTTGHLGLFVEGGRARFEEVVVREMAEAWG